MQPAIRLSQTAQERLRCPICHAHLRLEGQHFICTQATCATRFPIIDGTPVLLNERASVFSIADYVTPPAAPLTRPGKFKQAVRHLTPAISQNLKGRENYQRLHDLLCAQTASPRVLVVGGSILGQGMETLVAESALELVESDVVFGPRTALICDAHDIPFEDGAFDGVIVQAVLEHVVDPYRCAAEIHRVLVTGGLVYAETPFMQQVHMGRHDFTRFTHLGHRRLFRHFAEIDSGAVCGPGMALAWSYQYFLLSFTTAPWLRGLLRIFAGFTAFWLTYFDHLLIDKPGALDAASGYYFLGRRSEQALSDRELMGLYRGMDSL